jgi:hypothetical protein
VDTKEIDSETTEYGKIAYPIGKRIKKSTTARRDLRRLGHRSVKKVWNGAQQQQSKTQIKGSIPDRYASTNRENNPYHCEKIRADASPGKRPANGSSSAVYRCPKITIKHSSYTSVGRAQ